MLNPRPILITGATGQVGGAIAQLFPGALTPTRAELDLASEKSIRAYVRARRPGWIINPAAYTAVDRAESEPALAKAINAEAPRILGEEAARVGSRVVHFSTDYVFDGMLDRPYRETDAPGPASVYGETKLAGELGLLRSGAQHLILRTSWVYGATGRNFLLTILRLARDKPEIRIVADQHGAPTAAGELARLTAHLVALDPDLAGCGGLYHAAAAGETTWYGFASEAVRLARLHHPGRTYASLIPIPTAEYPTPAQRPANSRLNCDKLEREFSFRMSAWDVSLGELMSRIGTANPL